MDDILVDDTKLDGEEVIGIDQENDNNVGVGSSGLVKGSVNHDIPINHGPTPINVQVSNPFVGVQSMVDV